MLAKVKNILTRLAHRTLDSEVVTSMLEVLDVRSANRMSELGMIRQAFEFKVTNQVNGDYFEFGLWRGKTFCHAHRMKRRFRQEGMMLFGFDSFKGLPDIDDQRDNVWNRGAFACDEIELRAILHQNRFQSDEYDLFGGFYDESLNETLHRRLSGRNAAIVYVDCDLYTSTMQVLNFIRRYLVNGSIVCFDDFFHYKGAPDQGEQRALSEFLQAHPDVEFIPYMTYSPLGKSFIVRCN
jgi:hypothetical protein